MDRVGQTARLFMQCVHFVFGFLLLLLWAVKALVLNILRVRHDGDQQPPSEDNHLEDPEEVNFINWLVTEGINIEGSEEYVNDVIKIWVSRKEDNDPEDVAQVAITIWIVVLKQVILRLEWIGCNTPGFCVLHDFGSVQGSKSVSSAVALWWAKTSHSLCVSHDGCRILLAIELYGNTPFNNICSVIEGCTREIKWKLCILGDMHLAPAATEHLAMAIKASKDDLDTLEFYKDQLVHMKGVVEGRLSKEKAISLKTDEPKQQVEVDIQADAQEDATEPQPLPPPIPAPEYKPVEVEQEIEPQSPQQTKSKEDGEDKEKEEQEDFEEEAKQKIARLTPLWAEPGNRKQLEESKEGRTKQKIDIHETEEKEKGDAPEDEPKQTPNTYEGEEDGPEDIAEDDFDRDSEDTASEKELSKLMASIEASDTSCQWNTPEDGEDAERALVELMKPNPLSKQRGMWPILGNKSDLADEVVSGAFAHVKGAGGTFTWLPNRKYSE